jgi:hypothetical protein
MSHLIASTTIAGTATRAPALRNQTATDHPATDHTGTDQADLGRERPSRLWAMIEALAYAGAFIDPSGILAVNRLRQAQEEERRNGHH